LDRAGNINPRFALFVNFEIMGVMIGMFTDMNKLAVFVISLTGIIHLLGIYIVRASQHL